MHDKDSWLFPKGTRSLAEPDCSGVCVCGERGCSVGQVMHIKLEKNDKTGLYSEKESMGHRGTIH